MKKLAVTVLAGLAGMSVGAQTPAAKPRLVVGVVVDQLRTDYIDRLQDYFGERGFKTLLADGVYMRDVDFKTAGLDASSATALLHTGAYPSQTGVTAGLIYDMPGGAGRPPLAELRGASITNDSFTPAGLRLSTLADEMVIDSDGSSRVYSVAMDPQQAIILAGHAGTGAYWVNNSSGNWATTSYYGTLPSSLSTRNMRGSLAQRIDTMTWRPAAQTLSMPWLPEKSRLSPFKHTFSRQDRDVYKKFASSPLSNREVTDVAIDLIENLNLGKQGGATDMLNVAYTVAPYRYSAAGQARAELTDAYIKLDSQLSRLITAIDKAVGAGNALIWLTSTGYFEDATPVETRYRMPGGEFSTRKARSLLNSYLSARFGTAEYISAIRDGRIYFTQQTLERPGLDTNEVLEEARLFASKMSGVAEALTIKEILAPGTTLEPLRNALDPRRCGEIILRFTPGWDEVYDEQTPAVSKPTRESAALTPAFIMGPGIKSQTIGTSVEAVRLAPTVCGAINIRAPNGARAKPVL